MPSRYVKDYYKTSVETASRGIDGNFCAEPMTLDHLRALSKQ